MKRIFWIFLILAAIAGVIIYLRKRKAELGLATGGVEPLDEVGKYTPLPLPVLPGTDIPVGLRPRPSDVITAPIILPSWATDLVAKKELGDFIRAEITEGKGFILPSITKEQITTRIEQLSPFANRIIGKLGL